MHSMEHCWQAYRLAQQCFEQWRRGDVEAGIELDKIVEQVGFLAIAPVKDSSTSGTVFYRSTSGAALEHRHMPVTCHCTVALLQVR